MFELRHPFPNSITRLFDPSMVNAPSAWGVLEGQIPGVIAVGSAQQPTWAVGRMHWNVGFAAGQVDCPEAGEAAASLARWGSFGVFRSQNDPDIPGGSGASERIEFSGERFTDPSLTMPRGAQIVPLTATLLGRCQWGEGTAAIWGGAERFVEKGLGFCLVGGDEILCEVYAFAIGAGRVEISVVTHPDH